MHENDRSAADGSPETTVDVAERWRSARARRGPKMDAGAALADVRCRGRGTTPSGISAFQPRSAEIMGRSALAAGLEDVGDVPARLATGDLMPTPGARRAAESDRRPADAPARRHLTRRSDRRGPAPKQTVPCQGSSGRLLSSTLGQPPIRSGDAAGARIDHRLSFGCAAWPCAYARPVCSGMAVQAFGPAHSSGPHPHRPGGGCHGPSVQRRCRELRPGHHVQSRQVRA